MKFYRLSGATFYDCINTICRFIKHLLDNKMSIFEEYEAFKSTVVILNSKGPIVLVLDNSSLI